MKTKAATLVAIAATSSLAAAQCETALFQPTNGQVQDSFGSDVAVDGDTLIVSAPLAGQSNVGQVHFYERSGSTWTEVDVVDPTVSDDTGFGTSVGLSGDTAIIGYPAVNVPGQPNAGRAFVFERSGTQWVQDVMLIASDAEANDRFGVAVDIDGDTIVVGAHFDSDNGTGSGSVYVFERSPSGWVERAKLQPSVAEEWDLFGRTVAIDGDTIAVGSRSNIAAEKAGAVHVFERDPNGWTETAALVASDPVVHNEFGTYVSLDGDTLVTNLGMTQQSNLTTSVVYVLERSGGVWTETAQIEHNVPDAGDRFGFRHAISGDQMIITAPSTDNPAGQINTGAAYLFRRSGGVWTQLTQFRLSNLGEAGGFGSSAAIDGETAVIGAPTAFPPTFAGSAFAYQVPTFATPYGFCAAASPCGNDDPVAGCMTSAFEGAIIGACGSSSVSADDLVLKVSRLPINKWGILFMGPDPIQTPFGDGVRLVGPGALGTFRFDEQFGGTARELTYGPGLVAYAAGNFSASGQISAGSTWNFQGWFRDPTGPCGGGFNLSNAVTVEFAP